MVRAVEPESTTTSSSTSGASPVVSGTIAATMLPTVASSSRAGSTTDTRLPASDKDAAAGLPERVRAFLGR